MVIIIFKNWSRSIMSDEGRIFIGNVGPDFQKEDLQEAFEKFGNIKNIYLKEKIAFI